MTNSKLSDVFKGGHGGQLPRAALVWGAVNVTGRFYFQTDLNSCKKKMCK